MRYLNRLLGWFAEANNLGLTFMRIAIAVVFLWIGAVKFAPYEADSITPFVANNAVMSHFYKHPEQYKAHLTHEGELVPAQREWQTSNGTYVFANALGSVEIAIGLLVLAGIVSVRLGALGALLAFLTSWVTLSFLFTTPEAWVPALGDGNNGFPYLSGGGRLVLKDVMLWAGCFLLLVDAAKALRLRYAGVLGSNAPRMRDAEWDSPVSVAFSPDLLRQPLSVLSRSVSTSAPNPASNGGPGL